MSVMKPGLVTVNTDAGYYDWNGLASYAYWIRYGDGNLITGSGIFKQRLKSSNEAEEKAVLNAIHILKTQVKENIIKIIFNRDNRGVSGNPKHKHGKLIHDALKEMYEKHVVGSGRKSSFESFFEFRHVKSHRFSDNKKTWVNNRLDEMCTMELKNESVRLALEMRKNNVKIIKKKLR